MDFEIASVRTAAQARATAGFSAAAVAASWRPEGSAASAVTTPRCALAAKAKQYVRPLAAERVSRLADAVEAVRFSDALETLAPLVREGAGEIAEKLRGAVGKRADPLCAGAIAEYLRVLEHVAAAGHASSVSTALLAVSVGAGEAKRALVAHAQQRDSTPFAQIVFDDAIESDLAAAVAAHSATVHDVAALQAWAERERAAHAEWSLNHAIAAAAAAGEAERLGTEHAVAERAALAALRDLAACDERLHRLALESDARAERSASSATRRDALDAEVAALGDALAQARDVHAADVALLEQTRVVVEASVAIVDGAFILFITVTF